MRSARGTVTSRSPPMIWTQRSRALPSRASSRRSRPTPCASAAHGCASSKTPTGIESSWSRNRRGSPPELSSGKFPPIARPDWGSVGLRGINKGGVMSEQSVAVIKGVYDAFAQGGVTAVLGAFAPEIEWYEAEGMPYGGLHRGPEAIAQNVFGPCVEDIDEFAVTPEEFMSAGDTVAGGVRATRTGNGTG